jgi:anaerobic selenocysteine-containing dehydrogenase
MKEPEISRRGFMKLGALTLGGAGLATGLQEKAAVSAELSPQMLPDREVDSCCQFCQVRCTTKIQIKDGRVLNVYGNPDNFWTGGAMCPKGKSMVELTYSPHRIIYPMLREGNDWRRISYSQALDLVAERILKVKADYPEEFAHRVALFMPLWESRESELAALMALEMAGFPDACSPGDACIGSSATALRICLGSSNSPTTLDEVLNTHTLILWGANIAEMYPPYMRWIKNAKEQGVHIIYIDPRHTPTSGFCDWQYTPRPGTDGALALGIARVLIKEGFYDQAYVKAHVNGFDELVKSAEPYTPEKVEQITWIPAAKVVEFARHLGKSPRTMIWMGGSLSRYTNSMQTVRNIIALQAITNNLYGVGKGLMNVQGGKPGGENEFLEHYAHPDLPPKLNVRKVLYNMKKGRLDLLLLNGSYRRYPNANEVKKRIGKAGFVVYRGFFMDEEAQLSHLIIPGTMVYESEGSQYGAQRQVVWRNRAVEPPGETVEDWRFYVDLGKKLNPKTFPDINSAEEIYELVRKTVPSWKGLTLERLKASPTGITWPSYSEDEPESRGSIFIDGRFLTDDEKVHLSFKPIGPIRWYEPKGSPLDKKNKQAKDYPLIFTQGKVVHHWQHTYTNWSQYMGQFSEGNFVQVNPETVRSLGIKDGDRVFIETIIGKLPAVVKLSEFILPGVIFTPSHPAPANPVTGNQGVSVNTIVPNYWDKVSAQFNGFGCRLVKMG